VSEISLQGVTKLFGSVRALDDLSLDVGSGELIALLGPSGCGKTTLLRVTAGLEQPSAGRIFIAGSDVTDRPTRERSIGVVFQSYALFPNLTVRRNVSFPLEVRRWARADITQRVDELLALVSLTGQADRFPNQISGGQAQRCALARALAPRPAVLLLDEPLSALDVLVRTHLRDEIRRIQQSVRITTIYVTHDQSEALAIADRVAVMNHGRIEQVGAPLDIYAEPTTEFSAAFVGNRNALELAVQSGRLALGTIFDIPAPEGANGRAMAFFAPEDVEVDAGAEKGYPATVEIRTFHGATTRLHLLAHVDGSDIRLYADVPTRRADVLRDGAVVGIRIDGRHIRSFPVHD
jgi:putative spermidine/putrescine transport system ATP-binding protein